MCNVKYYLLIGILTVFSLSVVAFILYPLFFYADGEVMVYLRLFLVLFAVLVFAVLRMYNAIVANTRFLIKLREATVTAVKILPNVHKALRDLCSANGNLRSSVQKMTDKMGKDAEKN